MRLFFLFAPVFNRSAQSVVDELAGLYEELTVDGLVTGRASVVRQVGDGLGRRAGELHGLDALERSWLSTRPTDRDWEVVTSRFDNESVNRVLVADRQVGAGLVVGGTQPRSRLSARMLESPAQAPADFVCQLLSWCLETLERTRPDALFLYAVAGAHAIALAEAARVLDIPVRRMAPARIGQQVMVDSDPYGRLLDAVRLFEAARTDPARIAASDYQAARRYIDDFRNRPVAPDYKRQTDRRLRRATPLRTFARLAAKLPAALTSRDSDTVRAGRLWRGLYELSTSLRRRAAQRVGRSLVHRDGIPGRYVYFPLHVDPEASTMVMAPAHTDQIAVIEALAKSLPLDCVLVVKEHNPMIGRRPGGFYRRIARMPRVLLVPADRESFALTRDAALVCAITGTAGWEAMLLGVPALVVGTPHYSFLPQGVTHCPDLSALPAAVPAAMGETPCADDDLETFVAAIQALSFSLPPGFIWGEAEVSAADWNGCARAMANAIAASLDRPSAQLGEPRSAS